MRWDRLAHLQYRRAGWFLLAGALVAAGSIPLIRNLGLNSDFTALLPEDKPSVQDLEKVRGRVGGLSTLTLAIQSRDVEAMQRFAADLVPRLEGLDDENLRSVDWNVAAYEQFVRDHAHLYASMEDLVEVRDSLEQRLEYERARANPFYVQLDDEEPPDPREIVERLKRKAEEGERRMERYPGGYYIHPDRDLLAIFLRTDIRGGDVESIERLIAKVEREVEALGPGSYAPDLKVEYAGDVLHQREEHDAIARELVMATGITIAGVLLVIFLFFWRLRAIPLIGLPLMVPVLATFAIAELAVDYLNTSTAFLGSIVIGNGINPFIIWLARYFELRRGGMEVDASVAETHRSTWAATLTASLAAAIAYGSLIITDFRGFQDFGIIGGVGMVLCWLGTFTLTAPLAVVSERVRPLFSEARSARRGFYGILFAKGVFGAPRAILIVSVVLGVVGAALVGLAIVRDPIEYDFRKLRSVRQESSLASRLNGRIKEIVGGAGVGQGIALLVDDRDHVLPLAAELERMREEEGAPFGRVRTVHDLLPDEQEAKIAVLNEIRDLMADARRYADDEERAELDAHAIPEDLAPLAPEDLPESVARSFRERDGTVGRLVIVEQDPGYSLWDGRYLVDWAKALRRVRTEDGERPPLVGRAPVFADMIEVIWVDGPKAIGASFAATVLLVLVAFRRGRERLLTLGALLLGIVWMAGTMAAFGMKLNFLNFVAFPITFGNGVDYAVNLMRRYEVEVDVAGNDGQESVRTAVEESGGAVVLNSLTTIIGYTSLYTSANLALNSFGAAMAISEITCVLAALLTMPALLLVLARRRRAAPPPATGRAA